ncbi:MAG TPA: phage tail sheath C-terminal domain-containing protein, partial [Longimicrobium sp.]|nr:phage tail sheath C-terminal domain-containing protein [Longimicrobium sp.]
IYLSNLAYTWSEAIDAAQPGALTTYLDGVLAQIDGGAAVVLEAMQDPSSYNEETLGSPPADDTTVLQVAQSTAASQIPGPTQDAAQLVADAVLAAYDAPGASYQTMVAAAEAAVADVNTATAALGAAVSSPPPGNGDALMAALIAAVPEGETEQAAALIAVNEVIAQVMPTPSFALTGGDFPWATGTSLAEKILNDNTAAAVNAALPVTTAGILLRAPASFDVIAGAANGVATAAWLAATESGATAASVVAAAREAATNFRTNNPGAPQAAFTAATGVANATNPKVTGALTDPAVAASGAVAAQVAGAMNLQASNGAVTSLAAAQKVAVAAWQAVISGGDVAGAASRTAQTAGTDAISGTAARAVAGLATGTGQAAAVALSQGLVNAVIGALPQLMLNAANQGDWPNGGLQVALDVNGISASTVASMGLTPAAGAPPFAAGDFFNLSVTYTSATDGSQMSERWTGVSLRSDAGSNRLDRTLANGSNLVRFLSTDPETGLYVAPTGALPVPGATGVAGVGPAGYTGPSLAGVASAPLVLEDYLGNQAMHTGMYALDQVALFNILVIPPDRMVEIAPPAIPPTDAATDQWRAELYQTAAVYCETRRAFLILDPPTAWATAVQAGNTSNIQITSLGTYATEGEYAAVYFPYLVEGNPLLNGQLGYFAPSGAIAGIMARTDAARGVWKAPAGITDGAISGSQALELKLSDTDNGLLNPQGINCLRTFPVYGNVVWGARTLKGSDVLNDDYKYVPVRRLALFIEDSLMRGMQWAVFEPNAEPLWSQIRLTVGGFMNSLYRQGAFAGTTAKDAYYVACDATTTTPDDINRGIVNVNIGFAPLKPAEFVVITIQQIAGQTPT